MNFKLQQITKLLEQNLHTHLLQITPNHRIRDVYTYATIPPGKLFRPLLLISCAIDFSSPEIQEQIVKMNKTSDQSMLASALEIHHAYTLIHDDLPAMDNDDFRRGKKSTHKEHSEWEAILTGDGLLNGSYQLISKLTLQDPIILKLFSWALGPKGLIQGQVIDLSSDMNKSFSNLLRAHELKTARLIQLSLLLGFLTVKNPTLTLSKYRTSLTLARLGYYIGIAFQLLDDLTELTEEVGAHEITINPWFNFMKDAEAELNRNLSMYSSLKTELNLENVHSVLKQYFSKMTNKLKNGKTNIDKNLEKFGKNKKCDLTPIITVLDRLSL